MRPGFLRRLLVATVVLPVSLAAQDEDTTEIPRRLPSRLAFGVHAMNGQPVGDFGRAVNTSWGGAVDARYRVDRHGFLSVRGDVGLAGYGRTRGYASSGFFGSDRVTTQNSYGVAQLGLEVAQPDGPIRPYLNASSGLAWFVTSARANDDELWEDDDRSRTLVDDAVRASALGGGLRFQLSEANGSRLLLDLGARRWFTGPVTYATREDVVQGANGPTVRPRRSTADQWTFTIGFTVTR